MTQIENNRIRSRNYYRNKVGVPLNSALSARGRKYKVTPTWLEAALAKLIRILIKPILWITKP